MSLDYAPSVYVKTIKDTDNDKTKAVAEVAKYPTKSADLLKIEDEEQAVQALIVLAKTLKGRRLITFGGDFATVKRELKLDDIENGDLIHAEQETQNFNPVAKNDLSLACGSWRIHLLKFEFVPSWGQIFYPRSAHKLFEFV